MRDSEVQVSRLHLHGRHGHTASLVFRVFVTFAVALVLIVQLPSSDTRLEPMSAHSVPAGSPTTFRTDATEAELTAAGAPLLRSYRAFAVAHGPSGTLAVLRSHGRYAEPIGQSSALQFPAGRADVAAGPSPASWSVDYRGMAVGVVHFLRTPKPERPDAPTACRLARL